MDQISVKFHVQKPGLALFAVAMIARKLHVPFARQVAHVCGHFAQRFIVLDQVGPWKAGEPWPRH